MSKQQSSASLSALGFLKLVFKKNPSKVLLTIGCVLAAEGLEGLGFALFLPLIKFFTGASQPGLSQSPDFLNRFLPEFGTGSPIAAFLLLIVLVFAAKDLFVYFFKIFSERVTVQFEEDLRRELVITNFAASLKFHQGEKIGALLNATTDQATNAAHAFRCLIQLTAGIVNVAVFCLVGLWLSWKMFLLSVFGGALSFWVLRNVIRRSRQVAKSTVEMRNECQGSVLEDFSAIKFIKGNRLEEVRKERLFDIFGRLREMEFKKNSYLAIVDTLPDFIVTCFMCAVFYVSYAYLKVPGANILVLSAVLYQMNRRILGLQMARQKLVIHLPSIEFCRSILAKAKGLKEETGHRAFVRLNEGVRFDRISFNFGREEVLRSVNLEVRKNQLTAIVGKSGSGKTTALDLLMGLFRPEGGTITIDGVDIRDYDIFSWREKISYVPQEPFLFNGTIEDNIRMGKSEVSWEEIVKAAVMAHAQEFVEKMPEGFNTVVGDRGVKLSGGQRQRIALARALVRNPQVLILDEATSALDNESERMVKSALDELRGSLTIVVVAHRLTSIENADMIYVLEEGRIVESGKADALVSNRQVFHALYSADRQV